MTKQMFDGRDIGAFIPSTLDDFGLDPYQFRVYCRILRRAGNGACFESVNNIAEACRMDRKKVFSSLKFLLAHRLIEKEPTPKKGATVNYHLTPSSEWIHIEKPEKKPRGVPNMVHPPVPNMVHPPVPNMVHPPVPNMVHKGTPIEGTPIEERERALSLSDDFSFSENQDGAEQENPGSQDLDQSPPEDSTFVNEEDLNSQKNESCAPPQNNEAWDVDVLNKIWEANRSPKWKPSSLLILTKFISAGLDQFLATAGGNRSEAYRLIGIAIAQMSKDEFYGTRDRKFSDVLHFDLRDDEAIVRVTDVPDVPARDDLIVRAARLLQSATGTAQGADISIDKRIPAQAGMGGGSSDAASTLLALNRLWNLKLPLPQLEALGLQLGADVPFFLRGRNAWVEGIGEQITPIDLPAAHFCVLKPAAGVDTASIFRHPQLERATKAATIAVFAADPYGFGHNDLQPVAEMLCPEVKQAIELLEASGLQATMTGSGSAVFAHCAQGSAAIQAPDQWIVRECSNLEVHPLQGWAASDN